MARGCLTAYGISTLDLVSHPHIVEPMLQNKTIKSCIVRNGSKNS